MTPHPSLSAYGRRFTGNAIVQATEGYENVQHKRISLGSGLPPPHLYPCRSMTLEMNDGTVINFKDDPDLHFVEALDYLPRRGYTPLLNWSRHHIEELHSPPSKDWEVSLTHGNTDALFKIISVLADPNDTIFVDEATYPTIIEICHILQAHCIAVPSDADGMIPEKLQAAIDEATQLGRKPKALYTIPVGHNPLGFTMSVERKKMIYDICLKATVIIVEDDAYYYLQFPQLREGQDRSHLSPEDMPGLHNLAKSFLALDTGSIVVRMDSVSKFIAPGMRIGWLVAPASIMHAFELCIEMSTLHVSGPAGVAMYAMLKQWGMQGFHTHLQKVQHYYFTKCQMMLGALSQHLSEYCESIQPSGGMMLWVKLKHHTDSKPFFHQLAQQGVIFVPGYVFVPYEKNRLSKHEDVPPSIPYFRLTYAVASEEEMHKAFEMMAATLKATADS
eukprot:TRINITY_DN2176_c0_g1::TRINITY_DN2176_c0_g1_i1::g.12899::m.12899 TRINITY_DN2176_c0_g1::TRINITY_DN2176_c0_g1_i1::g.12899  ORF type:complete len:465 (+),score=81.44,sp/Q8N5Z0/AADAT_HUMAN/30.97/5e-67,Aminotran_1_2/PF00155.16/7.3e-20,FtsQ/PF03799.10/7.2,FtsQ/PF03799.10/35 TRINITY_DN2176_c0_g1_i1:60-1397(+)